MPRGIFIIRGENVVLCGEVSEETAESSSEDGETASTGGYGAGHHESLTRVDVEEILELQQMELTAKQERDKIKLKAAQESGLTVNYETLLDDF
jgi:U6 snRNA-associated Sm-like protein LSm1